MFWLLYITWWVLPSIEKIKGIFIDLPPNKDYEDKFVLGVFKNDNELIGIIDVLRISLVLANG